MNSNPMDAPLAWFDKQPPEVQQGIAFPILYLGPGLDLETTMEPQRMVTVLRQWLTPADEEHKSTIAGRVLWFRTLVNFNSRGWSTPDSWQRQKKFIESAKASDDAGKPQGFDEHADDLLRQLPFRQQLWLRAAQSWDELCEGPLSDETLDIFLGPETRSP